MKIAIGGIATESCTFSPLPTRLEDFRIVRQADAQFAALYPFLHQHPQVDFHGSITAKALPGGPVAASAYASLKSSLLENLRSLLPLDGVYLDMHGAMNVQGMDDAEGDLIGTIRELVGSDCVIAASYDLHGNVSQRIMSQLDVISGYRTAPHIDTIETRARTLSLLLRCLHERRRPAKAFVPIPIGLPGEKTSTEWQPGKALYAAIPGEIDGEQVWDATIQVGYVWADEPRMTACAIAIGSDERASLRAANRLAQRFWDCRGEFQFGTEALSIDDCLSRALAAQAGTVLISDSGDNLTAGGPGDVTAFLERALARQPADLVYAGITDAAAVSACMQAGTGGEVALTLGGKLDNRNSQPLPVRGEVEFIKADAANPQVVLRLGGIRVLLSARRTSFQRRQQFLNLGIQPEQHAIIAVKIGYLVPELKAMATGGSYLALSPGAVNQDITSLPFQRIQRPCYPFDADMDWAPNAQLV